MHKISNFSFILYHLISLVDEIYRWNLILKLPDIKNQLLKNIIVLYLIWAINLIY